MLVILWECLNYVNLLHYPLYFKIRNDFGLKLNNKLYKHISTFHIKVY